MEDSYNMTFKKDGNLWIGYVEELPGANSQGETLEEARENLKEAIALILESDMIMEYYFRQRVDNGICQLDEGKGIHFEVAKKRLKKWLDHDNKNPED